MPTLLAKGGQLWFQPSARSPSANPRKGKTHFVEKAAGPGTNGPEEATFVDRDVAEATVVR